MKKATRDSNKQNSKVVRARRKKTATESKSRTFNRRRSRGLSS